MRIDQSEVCRYLGYRGAKPDERTLDLIGACCVLMEQTARPRSIWATFDVHAGHPGRLMVAGSQWALEGTSAACHLEGCETCALMAVTLGMEVDRLIAAKQVTDMTSALVLDSCATAAVESLCDSVQREITCRARERGLYTTGRFSPGYGDMPLNGQRELLRLLDAPRRIGLSATEYSLLVPRKSVTAMIGLSNQPLSRRQERSGCVTCNRCESCLYIRSGLVGRGENEEE